jgi:hypothetical protein
MTQHKLTAENRADIAGKSEKFSIRGTSKPCKETTKFKDTEVDSGLINQFVLITLSCCNNANQKIVV